MSNQIHIIQNAITTTISEIFRGDFRRICEVKKAVLHLEAIYFCHGTCYLLKRENMPIKDQLALYQRIELIPQSTTEFFENNRECIINNWPEESALAAKPEILYDALLASEFCVQPERVGYKIDKVSRDIAGAYYTSSDFSAQITYRALESYMDRKRRRAIDSDSFACCNEYENITFLDYSCGCGEFLLAVIQYFDNYVLGYSRKKLATQLRGVDVNPIALMITIARIVSAVEAEDDENLLREVAKNFIVGNPLLHSDKIAPLEVRFDNFALNRLYAETEGINCLELEQQNLVVLGNPPWEKLRFEEQAFFRPVCPAISAISQKNKREKEIKKLAVNWLELSPKQREEFASVLKRTHLENIIATIRFIEDRYKVIEVLKTIVFDYAGYANERDHVQKIVEQHYWLFGEQYHLVTADKRMQKALEEYLYLLYGDKAPNPVLTPDEEELRRMDIFACAARNTEDANGSAIQENLVVELKAPKVVLTKAVLRQIEDYMDYVRKQPLFNSQYRRWKFIAVCSAVDDDVKARYDSQKSKGKKGLVAEIDNYEVYALTWDDVFQSFDLRHAFLLDKLKMDEEAIAAEIAQTAGDEKSKDTADALTALVAN